MKADRAKNRGKKGVPWGNRRAPSRKKNFREKRKTKSLSERLEPDLKNLLGEEGNPILPEQIPMSLKDLEMTLSGENSKCEYLSELADENRVLSTEELKNILEDNDQDMNSRNNCEDRKRIFSTCDNENAVIHSTENGNVSHESTVCQNLAERNLEDFEEEEKEFTKTIEDSFYVMSQLHDKFDHHSADASCEFKHMQLIRQRFEGMKTYSIYRCERCHFEAEIASEDSDGHQMSITDTFVLGSVLIGSGHFPMEELFTVMGVKCMAGTTYRRHLADMYQKIVDAAEDAMSEAADEEYKLAVARNDVHNGIPCIPVVCDGTWLKRSYEHGKYDSNSGVGVIVGYYTGKILFIGIRNKYCCICARAEKIGMKPKQHACFKNWNGSSSAMETDAILAGFQCSIDQHGLIYHILIADGDSSVYKALIETSPYLEHGIVIKKIECINHMLRCLRNHIKAIGTKVKHQQEGKNEANENKTMQKKEIARMVKIITDSNERLATAVREAVKFRKSENSTEVEQIKNLEKDCKNVPYHVFGQHVDCDTYFCDGGLLKENEVNHVPELKRLGLWRLIEDCFSRINDNCDSLIHNLNNNIVESANSIHCKLVAGKRINYGLRFSYNVRCMIASMQFNGHDAAERIIKAMGKICSPGIKKLQARRKLSNDCKKIDYKLSKLMPNSQNVFTDSTPSKKKKKNQSQVQQYGQNCPKLDLSPSKLEDKSNDLMEKLKKWQNERSDIEEQTRAKNGLKWIEVTKNVIISDHFGKICRMHKLTPRDEIVKSIIHLAPKQNRMQRYTQRNKSIVKSAFAQTEKLDIVDCGLFIDDELAFLAAAPGGIIYQNSVIYATAEIICPHSATVETPLQVVTSNMNGLSAYFNQDLSALNPRNAMYYKIQGDMHIVGCDFCYVILWTPVGMEVIKVPRDHEFWSTKMRDALKNFFTNFLRPEIIDSRFQRNMPIKNTNEIVTAGIEKRRRVVQLLPNNLFNDPEFYFQDIAVSYAVGYYLSNNEENVSRRAKMCLFSNEFRTLQGNTLINGDVIDAFMVCKVNRVEWRNVKYVTTQATTYIVGDFHDRIEPGCSIYQYNWQFTGKMFLPYTANGHWCLLVLDADAETIMHLDPLGDHRSNHANQALLRFNKFWVECSKHNHEVAQNTISWKIDHCTEPRPLQNDGVNCGVFVMHYMNQIGQGVPLDVPRFNVTSFRKEVSQLLIESSESMQNICIYCFGQRLSMGDEPPCPSCGRRKHPFCFQTHKGVGNVLNIDWNSDYCVLCYNMFTRR